jgi:hypothetical protein
MNQVESEEQRILMALSQTYLDWEPQTERRGQKIGLEEERRATILNLMKLRYGAIDSALEAVIPNLMELSNEGYTRLLFQLSKEELIQHFAL